MILLYRIIPGLVAVTAALGYTAMLTRWGNPFLVMALSVLVLMVLLARLLRFQFVEFSFWVFIGIASLFFVCSFGILLLFETTWVGVVVAVGSGALLVLFSEFLFSYTHLPARYQPFSLEHLSSLMNLLTMFYLGALAFALRLFIQMPLVLLTSVFFLFAYFLIYGMLWVAKTEAGRAKGHAFFGAILLTELFVAITYLPTGFYTNAAFMTVCSYVFFGLTRTEALHKLSPAVVKRYLIIACVLLGAIAISSQWL